MVMKKSIITIIITALILIGAVLFEQIHIGYQFSKFENAISILQEKTASKTALTVDAENVRDLWQDEKKTLHIYIPHSDIEFLDYWLNEAVSLISTKNYDEALAKLEVVLEITKNTAKTYSIEIGNVF